MITETETQSGIVSSKLANAVRELAIREGIATSNAAATSYCAGASDETDEVEFCVTLQISSGRIVKMKPRATGEFIRQTEADAAASALATKVVDDIKAKLASV